MLRFTIRDVLWLTVVVALVVALGIEHRRFTTANVALQEQQAKLHEALAKARMAELRAKELMGGVILTPAPMKIWSLEMDRLESPRAKDK